MMTHTQRLILLVIISFGISGCSTIIAGLSGKTPEEQDPAKIAEARIVISTLKNKNTALKNFKGIGKIKVWDEGKIQIDERVAWIGSEPAKISIAVLISGYPAIKLAADGEWFYYLEVQGNQNIYKKIPAPNADLKRVMSISIHSNDVITLLAGRVPIREYNSAYLKEDDTGAGYVLILKKRWCGIVEKIYIDRAKSKVRQLEVFSRAGSLVYRAILEKVRDIQGYGIPFRLKISNDDGADFQLDIDRYWANISVSPSMFVLIPPD
jgi:uncharacterized protein YceK